METAKTNYMTSDLKLLKANDLIFDTLCQVSNETLSDKSTHTLKSVENVSQVTSQLDHEWCSWVVTMFSVKNEMTFWGSFC